ncbi:MULTISPECIES: Hsp20/alpha crystallin family protein [Psychrilyobacter]|uniref:Hsp20/alpha crystallin family protein n=1 Tax=Psychrilyobacter piezotolerans TaxID=2293438 RepID=A0ABX9KI85_9FUSO|nr:MULTISPECIES: Hsp20/alpha crystallin family protein [Psychrilyobacter]MCS5421345.1 Hsp20/alpha crystallin family protein [Psychrilyobacter sp. S5]NDI77515.1 Hsp20/alpha crystallin family protein [Psychrilyobacter piezotolerans]RDE62972.1 Hsp20/alpha crystallin family protein [Psychrilyobacter sp. S5]REI41730.1 Hsp20/alpha crystallin family protein [Psychrilyobacter piezotolerans]
MSNLVKKHDFFYPNVFGNLFEDDIFTDRLLHKRIMPPINVSENEENYQVDLSIPGIKKENIKITCKGRVLTISYEQENSDEYKEKNYHRREFKSQSFTKSFTVPKDVNLEKISSEHKNGILAILLPKFEVIKEENSMDIEIK